MPERNGRVGKADAALLLKVISSTRSILRPSTVIPPEIGEDAGVIELPTCMLVAHVDPITEAVKGAGRLAVIVSANDVAATGARPQWAQVLLLAPPGYPDREIEELASEIGAEAARIGVEILGGHTEYAPGIEKPVVAVFTYGCACKECLTPTAAAKPGDIVALVGWAGLEGMKILAADFSRILAEKGVGENEIRAALRFDSDLSIVNVAVDLAESRVARAMHDATEGGVIGALVEMALASGTRIVVDADAFPIPFPLRVFAAKLGIDPLTIISSGALIVSLPEDKVEEAKRIAEKHRKPFNIVGRVERGPPSLVLRRGGEETVFREPPEDAIAVMWRRYGHAREQGA